MGNFSSGIGLVSGFDIENFVSQMMKIEGRTKDQVIKRKDTLATQQEAMMKLQIQVMAVQLSASNFNKQAVFEQKSITSSNADALSASASRYAVPGSYKLNVVQLATHNNLVSRGFSSANSGIGSGTLSFEMGRGQVAAPTDLAILNGQQGIQRGKINITDRAGNSAQIDLTSALSVDDILNKINQNNDIKIKASVSGGKIVLDDISAGSGAITVSDVGVGRTASDLGILGSVDTNKLVGSDILYLSKATHLTSLNDGNGIRGLNDGIPDLAFHRADGQLLEVELRSNLFEMTGSSGENSQNSNLLRSLNRGAGIRAGEFKITDRNGRSINIQIDQAMADTGSLGDLKNLIQQKATDNNMDITVSFNGRNSIELTDNSKALDSSKDGQRYSNFMVEAVDGSATAKDLGIQRNINSDRISGTQIWYMDTVEDVMNSVNNHWNNRDGGIVLAINDAGNALKATDLTGNPYTSNIKIGVPAGSKSFAAIDLGLVSPDDHTGITFEGSRLIGGLNTVMLKSLNGGNGGDTDHENYGDNQITAPGIVSFNDRLGNQIELDFSNAFTLNDVIEIINSDANTTNITAAINSAGNGIVLRDLSAGTGNMTITDITGDLATKLNLAADVAGNTIDSKNLQLQYISEATQISSLRQGQGINRGKFEIIDGLGNKSTIDLQRDGIDTVGDIVKQINLNSTNVKARINDDGDGIILEDFSEGPALQPMVIKDIVGKSAANLGFLNSVAKKNDDGKYFVDGSYEVKFEVGGGDSIGDIMDMVNRADIGIRATIINDGQNYRLSFVSEVSGQAGNVFLDTGTTSLAVDNLQNGRDAIILMGDENNENPMLIRSSSNSVKDAIRGVTMDLNKAGTGTIEVDIKQDIEGIVSSISSFVEAYNTVMKEISELTKFDAETYRKGILFANHSVSNIKNSMVNMVQRIVPGQPNAFNRLSSIGLTFAAAGTETTTGADGQTVSYAVAGTLSLSFDEQKFRDAFSDNPDAVKNLFTSKDIGIGDFMADRLESLASTSLPSTMKNALETMSRQQKMHDDRITYLERVLKGKEDRMYKQFYAMEEALSKMQSQQSSISQLASLTESMRSSKK